MKQFKYSNFPKNFFCKAKRFWNFIIFLLVIWQPSNKQSIIFFTILFDIWFCFVIKSLKLSLWMMWLQNEKFSIDTKHFWMAFASDTAQDTVEIHPRTLANQNNFPFFVFSSSVKFKQAQVHLNWSHISYQESNEKPSFACVTLWNLKINYYFFFKMMLSSNTFYEIHSFFYWSPLISKNSSKFDFLLNPKITGSWFQEIQESFILHLYKYLHLV